MPTTPHYLRVARALALVSGLAGLPACAESRTVESDSGSRPDATASFDAGDPDLDAGEPADSGAVVDGGLLADAGAAPDAGGAADAGQLDDAGQLADAGGEPCATCECTGRIPEDAGPDVVSCEAIGLGICCAVIGPLFPPDLAA